MIPDKSKYPTHLHPGGDIDWPAFYAQADQRSETLRASRRCLLNASFGPHSKQSLDLYFPDSGKGSPVFLFIHGGGFQEGDKYHYGFVAEELARAGVITAVTSYRLSPEFRYPEAIRDIEAAVAWIYRNLAAFGGDPDRIFIGGHSAGGILTAEVAFKQDWSGHHDLPPDVIKGCVLISGPYDVRGVDWVVEYAPDLDTQTAASPLFHLQCHPGHSVVALGTAGQEAGFRPSNDDLVQRLESQGASLEYLVLEGMNHDDTVLAMADSGSKLFSAVTTMIEPE